jgi:hypothetical protein
MDNRAVSQPFHVKVWFFTMLDLLILHKEYERVILIWGYLILIQIGFLVVLSCCCSFRID